MKVFSLLKIITRSLSVSHKNEYDQKLLLTGDVIIEIDSFEEFEGLVYTLICKFGLVKCHIGRSQTLKNFTLDSSSSEWKNA